MIVTLLAVITTSRILRNADQDGRPGPRSLNIAVKSITKFETAGPIRRNIFRSWRGAPEMIEIILTVCAVANPANCEDKYLQFAWEGSINQCMMGAQPYIAQWIGDHPQWTATKWTCEYPGHEKRKI
jgi:hypothetical protein